MPDLIRKNFQSNSVMTVLSACPVGLGSVLPDGRVELNQAGKTILNQHLGLGAEGQNRWASAAVARLQARNLGQEIIKSQGPETPDLEIKLGSVNDSDTRILALVPQVATSGHDELAESVSTLSHELRTPLTSMKSSLNLVLKGETGCLNEDQRHFLAMTMRNIERLDRLVSDLLDVARADAGQLNLRLEKMDLVEVLGEMVATHQEMANSRDLNLIFDCPLAGLVGRLDGDKVVQIITNLLSNAMKFTSNGGRVQLGLARETNVDGDVALIEVRDTGSGMDATTLKMAMEPFQRHGLADLESIKGSGLGLHIVQGLVKVQGGLFGLDSRLGKGTLAWVRLPLDGQNLNAEEKETPIFV